MLSFCLLYWCFNSYGFQYPAITLFFNQSPPSTVFYGETLSIPVQLNYGFLRTYKHWTIPAGSSLHYVSGVCPAIPYDTGYYFYGTCHMKLVIPGVQLGKVIQGSLGYRIWGKESGYHWDWPFATSYFSVRVVPHKLSMATMMPQSATANLAFIYNLKPAIKYYDENVRAGTNVVVTVEPAEQDGLHFDPSLVALTGKPSHTGTYIFKVTARNKNGSAEPVSLRIDVEANIKDKPVFKEIYPVVTAVSGKKYHMALMNLIEPQTGFKVTNQVSFRIEKRVNTPDWLTISKADGLLLTGEVPDGIGGTDVEINLIATSNTGGDSEPFTLKIPVAHDPEKIPVIDTFELCKDAGSQLHENLSQYIHDPAFDNSLQLILDKVTPDADWINVSPVNPTMLNGTVPMNATGKKFMLTLRASTVTGGSSEPVTVPLQINIDKEKTPRFKNNTQVLPILYPGQAYIYDFVEHSDVYPEYDTIPYEIEFADENSQPYWLRIEHNQLIADKVPEDIDKEVEVKVIIRNIPGGKSKPISLHLTR
ncbi:putative Ig domain-containing protein [Legionella shakespearei]|nr:putative Ig domain-containing protein [Legionella shakespearei]